MFKYVVFKWIWTSLSLSLEHDKILLYQVRKYCNNNLFKVTKNWTLFFMKMSNLHYKQFYVTVTVIAN